MNAGMRINLSKSNQVWDLRTKVRRSIWNLTQAMLFRPTPKRRGNRFRIFLLRCFGAKIHGTPLIHQTCRILLPWELEVGEFSAIGNDVEIYNYARVRIGTMTMISQYSYLCTGSHDYEHPHMPLTWAPIDIGSECWIASGVFVGPGTEIGNGTVVGACSVVTKSMPEWMVCVGNPCRPLKPRVIIPDARK
jgi:putative colanic acid biosynthesis acetyltransferase WcaF